MNDIVTPFSSDPMNSLGDITSEENQNRTCGTCAACCTQLGVNELKKHASQVCSHLKNGDPLRRCGIYPTRPKACETYLCAWRIGLFKEDMRPDMAGFVISAYPPLTFVIQVFDRARAGSINEGKLNLAVTRILASGTVHDIKVVDVQKKEVLHFLNGEIRSGKLLRQDKNDYESLAFVSHDPPIGRYETKEIKP